MFVFNKDSWCRWSEDNSHGFCKIYTGNIDVSIARTENIVVYKSFPTEDATGHADNGKKSPIISEFN